MGGEANYVQELFDSLKKLSALNECWGYSPYILVEITAFHFHESRKFYNYISFENYIESISLLVPFNLRYIEKTRLSEAHFDTMEHFYIFREAEYKESDYLITFTLKLI